MCQALLHPPNAAARSYPGVCAAHVHCRLLTRHACPNPRPAPGPQGDQGGPPAARPAAVVCGQQAPHGAEALARGQGGAPHGCRGVSRAWRWAGAGAGLAWHSCRRGACTGCCSQAWGPCHSQALTEGITGRFLRRSSAPAQSMAARHRWCAGFWVCVHPTAASRSAHQV